MKNHGVSVKENSSIKIRKEILVIGSQCNFESEIVGLQQLTIDIYHKFSKC